MKIAFIGSHGVGKTTLCYRLAGILKKRMPSVDIVKEVARSCPLPINRDTNLAAQRWILHTQIALEIAAQELNDTVICDRSVLDNYAYLVAAQGPHADLDSLVTRWIQTYDYLFRVPIGFALQRDGVRDLDLAFQKEIDVLVGQLLREREVRCYHLSGTNREIWLAFIVRVLDRDTGVKGRPADRSRQMTLDLED